MSKPLAAHTKKLDCKGKIITQDSGSFYPTERYDIDYSSFVVILQKILLRRSHTMI